MNKNPSFFIKIRPTISFVLIILLISVVSITLSLQYYFSKELALSATKENFSQISQKVEQKIMALDKKNNDIISVFEAFEEIKITPEKSKRHELIKLFTATLKNNKYIYALYVGNKNGDFYEVINLDITKSLREKYNASKDARWLVVKIYERYGQRYQYEEFLDVNLNQIKAYKNVAKYDPSKRPWFKDTLESAGIIKTKPYMYTNLEAKGITYAKRIIGSDSVFGIDVSLESMNNFIKSQVSSEKKQIFLFKKDGTLSSSVNYNFKKDEKELLPYENVQELVKTKVSTSDSIMNINNKEYFVYFSKIDSIYDYNKDFLTILTPVDSIMQPYIDKINYTFLITLAILTLTIPLIWYSTRIIVTPIHRLAKENEKVMNRDFDNVQFVNTRIQELFELSESLVKMSKSIKDYEEKQKELMDSFIRLIASAIDAKSKYTGEHCERVPILTMQIAQAASNSNEGIFKDFKFESEEEKRELSIAAWLHDCGKVTTPEYVVDKATKLETIYNRLHEIRTRFEVIHRDKTIKMYENILNGANKEQEEAKLKEEHQKLYDEFTFIANVNIGGEFMKDEDIQKVKDIAQRTWNKYFDDTIGLSYEENKRLSTNEFIFKKEEKLLDDKKDHIIAREHFNQEEYDKYNFKMDVPEHLYNTGEIYNLSVRRGTLTNEERFKINEHMIMSIIMLEQLPLPDHLKRIPEYAGSHHETLIGTGYPRKLTKEQMSIPARIMAVADIFEALTASDRPYKKAKTLSESIKILSFMVKDQHIDPDIFKLFLTSGVYKQYAKEFLQEDQIDEVDISLYT